MHLSEFLNRPPPTVEVDTQEAEVDLDIGTNPTEIVSDFEEWKSHPI